MKKIISGLVFLATAIIITACGKLNTSTKKEEIMTNKVMDTRIHFYRNATMKIEYAGNIFLTDPMFAKKGAFPGYLHTDKLVNPTSKLTATKEEIIKNVEFILLSHTHVSTNYDINNKSHFSDHMDSDAIKTLDKNMPIYLQAYDLAGMQKQGFQNLNVIDYQKQVNNISITRFDGLHVDEESWIQMIGESSGYVLKADNAPTILWAGDTLLTDNIKNMIVNHKPDIIILHPGKAQMPKDDKGNMATLLMGVDETIEVAKLAPQAKIIAIHLEALDHCSVKKEDLRKEANKHKISASRLIIPENGEIINL